MTEGSKEYKIEGRPSTIFRTVKNKDNPYVMIDQRPILNPTLSYKAKGILAYMTSRPDGWEYNMVDLANRSTDGLASVKAGVKELQDAGHIKLTKTRTSDGKFGTVIWEVYETPQVGNQLTVVPDMGGTQPEVEKPQADKPQADNRIQVLKELSINDIKSSSDDGEIFKAYENNIGLLTPMISEKIGDAIDTYPPLWILEAIQEAVTHNGRSWAYINKILINWDKNGRSKDPDKKLSGMSEVDLELQKRGIRDVSEVMREKGV